MKNEKEKAKEFATVIAQFKQRYELKTGQGIAWGQLKSAVFYNEADIDFPTVGDMVEVQREDEVSEYQIVAICPRKSVFYRYNSASLRSGRQAVAANMDYIWILTSCNQDLNLRRLERYVAQSWQSGAQPVVVLTKSDLVPETMYTVLQTRVEAVTPGVPVHVISSISGQGLEGLAPYLKPGKTIAFIGSSGVGKSSLVNAIMGEEVMETSAIREKDDRGRHTTTHRQMLFTQDGVKLLDTPGMRTLALWDNDEGVDKEFPEVEQFLGKCRFRNCTHQNEEGCAIRSAIAEGLLDEARWQAYVALQKEAVRMERHARHVAHKAFRSIEKHKHKQENRRERKKGRNLEF